jgi:hypothetical protein
MAQRDHIASRARARALVGERDKGAGGKKVTCETRGQKGYVPINRQFRVCSCYSITDTLRMRDDDGETVTGTLRWERFSIWNQVDDQHGKTNEANIPAMKEASTVC